MLPSDVLGVTVWEPKRGEFVFKPGPLFTNVVLADEINRTTPKTQSSLLEAMNEAQVSLDHSTYPLPRPFMVLATQNPLEYEGTYPLPESQLDRFLLRIRIGYPDRLRREGDPARRRRAGPGVARAGGHGRRRAGSARARWTRARRRDRARLPDGAGRGHAPARRCCALGVSPRGSLALLRAARARALADGRDFLVPDDLKALAVPALAHRVIVEGRVAAGESGRRGRHQRARR